MKKTTNLEEAITVIKNGGVIVFPTDTIYGLICDAINQKAIQKLFQIKKRDLKKPIPVFVKDIETAKQIAIINEKQERFLEKVWPGKTTVVLEAKIDFPQEVLGKNKTIGLRVPNHAPLNALLNEINKPLSGTSANLAGESSSTDINDIIDQFKNEKFQPDLVVDSGTLESSKPSTVIDLSKNPPVILREGAVSGKELLKIF
ncbi:MAG: L-threonylcarbamoyladenylate synthase [Patescibacteria group bacterium]